MNTKDYTLSLPVFKQGDDLRHHLDQSNNDPKKAFAALAEQYIAAAEVCKMVVELEVSAVQADTHHISFSMDESAAQPLVTQGILTEEEAWEDEYEDECNELKEKEED